MARAEHTHHHGLPANPALSIGSLSVERPSLFENPPSFDSITTDHGHLDKTYARALIARALVLNQVISQVGTMSKGQAVRSDNLAKTTL